VAFRAYLHPTDGDTGEARRRSLLELLRGHAPAFTDVDPNAFVTGDEIEGDAPVDRLYDSGEWLVLSPSRPETYERRLLVADLLAAVVDADGFDWATLDGEAPEGSPTPQDVGTVVAVGGEALERIGRDRLTTAPAFGVYERDAGVAVVTTLAGVAPHTDPTESVETVAAYLAGSGGDVDPGAPVALDTVPAVGDDPVALLDALGDWRRWDVETTIAHDVDQPTVDRVTGLLDDGRAAVREEALWALDRLPDDALPPETRVEACLDRTEDTESAIRRLAVETATDVATGADETDLVEAVQPVARELALNDPDPAVRTAGTDALRDLLDEASNREAVLGTLREVYETDTAAEPRAQAVGTVANYEHDAAILFDALEDDAAAVRSAAAAALQTQAAFAGTSMGSPELFDDLQTHVGAIRRAMSADDDDVRAAATRVLGLVDVDVETDVVVETMRDDPDESTRAAAARALQQVGDGRDLPALATALGDESGTVREAAADAVETIYEAGVDDPEVDLVPPLLSILAGDDPDERRTRGYAAAALGAIGDERAVDPILTAVDEDRVGRWEGLEPLGEIGGLAVDRLCERLRDADRNDDVTGYAKGLAAAGDDRAVEPLVTAYRSGSVDRRARREIGKALGRLGGDRAREALVEGLREGRPGAEHGLGALGSPAVEPLLSLLDDETVPEDVRREASLALGRTGDPRAIERLLRELPDADGERAGAVCRALGHTEDDRLVPVLRQLSTLASTEAVQEAAAEGLEELCQSVRREAFAERDVRR
jgi:HEAT repeat protein